MNEIPVILSLETATPGGSIFLGHGETELASLVGDPLLSHSDNLLRDIAGCLSAANISLTDIEIFACAAGPGSFTGLRIGLATLKALAATLERPCVGIPTLRALAHAAGPSPSIVAVLPAGRGEVFAQMFSYRQPNGPIELDDAAHLSPAKLVEKYGKVVNLVWVGSGAHAQREFLTDYAQQQNIAFEEQNSKSSDQGWKLAPAVTNLAKEVAILSMQALANGQEQSAQSLSAIYVRPSDAELNQTCR